MPYFKNNDVNLLFIHIPKTGGTSLEKYFSNRYNISLNNESLYDLISTEIQNKYNVKLESSLQHLTYNTIMDYKDFLNIDMNCIKIISIVRNPYDRLISDLFYLNKINKYSTKEEVYCIIQTYLTEYNDNHVSPQYLFLINKDMTLDSNINILHTETLNEDMIRIGYTDFNINENCNPNKINSYDYLNDDSINLINCYYEKDFTLFNYNIIYR
jgi:hypothetical protein